MISLLLHGGEAEDIGSSVNSKDIIRMYLGYNCLIAQKTLPINASFVKSKKWLQVMFQAVGYKPVISQALVGYHCY